MAKFHINKAGNPGSCQAKPGNCPYGSERDHYSSKEDAREIYEAQQELLAQIGVGGKHPLSSATETALTADLQPLDQQPAWIWEHSSRLQQELFGVTPQVIATVDSPLGPLAVVWEEATVEPNDLVSEVEDGYLISRISYRTMATGELVGYLKTTSMSEESVAKSFGNDEWRGLRYSRTRESFYPMDREHVQGQRDYDPHQSAEDFERSRVEPPKLDSKEKLVEFVGKAQSHFRSYSDTTPHFMDEPELRSELSRLQELANENLDHYRESFEEPFIDYIKLDREELRGQGLGASLYVFMARKQAERGLPLRASGLQTPEAETSWRTMAADTRFPIRVANSLYRDRNNRKVSASFFLDFRNQD